MRFLAAHRWGDLGRFWAARWGWSRLAVVWLALGFVVAFAALLLWS